MSSRLDEQRGRYIDVLLTKIEEHADDEPVRESYCDRVEAILRGPAPTPASVAADPPQPVVPKRHPSGLGWIDLASRYGAGAQPSNLEAQK
jgi:hypothetical protein